MIYNFETKWKKLYQTQNKTKKCIIINFQKRREKKAKTKPLRKL